MMFAKNELANSFKPLLGISLWILF